MIASSQIYLTAGFMLVAALTAFAGDVKVIANPSVTASSISIAELRTVFLLQRKTLIEGSPVAPVIGRNGVTTDAFMKRYLNRDIEEVRTYYQGLVFTGKGAMPKQLNSDAEMVDYVARTKGAIGYVGGSTNTVGVKVLVVISEESKGERVLLTRVEPIYPETLQRLAIGGSVRLELTISPKGTVESVAILGGNPILAEAAVKATKQWAYAPRSSQTRTQVIVPFEPRP
jgi:TonB family protein